MNNAPTERTAWLCRSVWRLRRLYGGGKLLPTTQRPLTWSEYTRLVEHIRAEHREDPHERTI